MNNEEREALKKWVERWKRTGEELERIRRAEMMRTDLHETIELLEDAFQSAVLHHPPEPTSGLIEQQRLFRKLGR